ncbi:type II toxin-antitoxin system mRNA interferase toxin, RelE/StbE family [Nitrospira defluvii]|nr:type II toxin-antitoxin system mRNA interferase toxin, RelE/StbE family [Nitrospira defluvii]
MVYEYRGLVRKIHRLPKEILKRYEKWKDIVSISSPQGLKLIKGFHDEALKGKWVGYRSSRLGLQYRVIYRIENEKVYVEVIDITSHDYRRK